MKRLLLLVACTTTPQSRVPTPIEVLETDPEIATMSNDVSSARVHRVIGSLVSYGTRNSCSETIADARSFLRDRFHAMGLRVALDGFEVKCDAGTVIRENVVAWKPGKSAERLVIVGGHYDSRGPGRNDPTAMAPGANDSGSQTALVLEVAGAMAKHEFDATVVFVTFAGEEQGLLGSTSLTSDLETLFPNARVIAMMNADIVGGDAMANDARSLQFFRLYSPGAPRETGTSPYGTTDNTSLSRGLMRYVGTWGKEYVPEMTMIPKLREDRVGRGGDHIPFIAKGLPAVRFIETEETLAHQHSIEDGMRWITPAYTARIARVVISVAASLARAPDAPRDISVTGDRSRFTITWQGDADHFVVAARSIDDNFYARRLRVVGGRSLTTSAAELGMPDAFFISVAAVDAEGHESLFAYPEWRCAGTCVVPPRAMDSSVKQ